MNREEQQAGSDEQRMAELIGTLRRVDAPGDFDTRVRARIAAARKDASTSSWRPLVVGLATAVVIVGAGIGFLTLNSERSISSTEPNSKPQVISAVPATPSPEIAARPTVEVSPAIAQTHAPEKQPHSKVNAPVKTGGSIDQALKDVQRFDPRGPRQANSDISVGSLLNTLGADATWNGSGWQIGSVKQHSIADRSTLRTGDVVEAIDGKTLSADTKMTGISGSKSLRVRRSGTAVEVPLRP